MQLEEIKILWEEMSADIEKQKKITDALIIKMTKADYRNKINKIWVPEATASLVCFACALGLLVNLQKLNTWYLLLSGIIAVLILILLPVLSIRAICTIRSVNISGNNYKESLLKYAKGKIQFVFAQKLSFYLGAILMLVILPVMSKLIDGKDIFIATRLWLWYAIAFPFFYGLSRWIFKSYIKITTDAENILNELEH
jgi:hypothetical protein